MTCKKCRTQTGFAHFYHRSDGELFTYEVCVNPSCFFYHVPFDEPRQIDETLMRDITRGYSVFGEIGQCEGEAVIILG